MMCVCREHWFAVCKTLRDAIWRAWEQRQKDPCDTAFGTKAHRHDRFHWPPTLALVGRS